MALPQDSAPKFQEYAHPEMIVSTEWVAQHLENPGLVVAESDEDVLLYETGHVPGAVKLDWHTELNDPVTRDDARIRAFKDQVLAHLGQPMIDVRSPGEYSGELLHMPDYPQEGALRGGHIPGAKSVPWARAAAEDATFRTRAELEAIYQGEAGLSPDDDVVVYCRIGERSSHTWFVLQHLLGYGQ